MKPFALLLLLTTACPALEEQSHISKLRVLAVRADPAELLLEPDAGLPAAALTALAVLPDGGSAEQVRYALCAQLTGVPDPSLDCPGDAGIDLPADGPLGARLDLSDPRILEFAAGVDAGAFDAGSLQALLDEGVPLVIGFSATAGDQSERGFQTLTLRTVARGPANLNPANVTLDIADGGEVLAGASVRLQPSAVKDDPAEHYLYSFFATAGSIDSLHSTDTTSSGQPAETFVTWTAPGATPQVHLWAVVRDGHGGVAWTKATVPVR